MKRENFLAMPYMATEFAEAVIMRFKTHLDELKSSHRAERMIRMWCQNYSFDRDGGWDNTEISQSGANSENTLIRPNEMRSLMQSQLNLITQTPPGYECVAVNNDSASHAATMRGNGILDYYHRVLHLDDVRVERAEAAMLLGESFMHAPWNPSGGAEAAVDDQTGVLDEQGNQVPRELVYEGEFDFSVGTPFDWAYDPLAKDRNRPRWTIGCEPANRYDLAAQYPGQAGQIMDAEPHSKHFVETGFAKAEYEHDDYVSIYFAYGEKSPSKRDGRSAIVLDDRTVLVDGPLADDRIPVFRLAPGSMIKRSGGYTNNFDLLPLQEIYNAQMSTILSNHTAFGKQWVTAPKGSNVKPHHLSKGLGLIEYDLMPGGRPPEALSLLATQREHMLFLAEIRESMERFTAIPKNMRGQSTAGDSGSKEALIHAAAEQFASAPSRALARSDEDLGSYLIASLQSRATTKRMATVLGRYSSYSTIEFDKNDLSKIARVSVRTGDPMRDTAQGREMRADKLMKFPDGIISAAQYITYTETGRTEPLFESTRDELMAVRRENEQMQDGKPQPVSKWERHSLHLREQRAKATDESVRQNPAALAAIEEHLQWHLDALTPGNPRFAGFDVLLVTGEKPIPAPQPMGPPDVVDGGPPNAKPNGPAGPGAPQVAKPGGPSPGMPRMPSGPTNPATGKRAELPDMKPPAIAQGS